MPLAIWQDSEMDKGQGSETVKVGDGELMAGLGEEMEGEGVFTVGETVFTVGLAF